MTVASVDFSYVACPVCGRDMESGRYICSKCEGVMPDTSPRLVAARAHLSGRGVRAESPCLQCGHGSECEARVRAGLWLICEIPDELDLLARPAQVLAEYPGAKPIGPRRHRQGAIIGRAAQ